MRRQNSIGIKIASIILSVALMLAGCGAGEGVDGSVQAENYTDTEVTEGVEEDSGEDAGAEVMENEREESDSAEAAEDVTDSIPLNVIDDNYRTYYEVFVYSFCDSDGDGIGDLQGLISKLDYINDGDDTTDTDLGCNGIWLMPVNPSPTYHKYDVADYYAIDEEYGTMDDFKELLAECDKRGIKVIMDLVLNHSSSQNPWFQEACAYLQGLGDAEPSVEECPYFDYYHFSKEQGGGYYAVEGTDWYYEAQFWFEMPDLNLDCEALKSEIAEITKYWLALGVGGFRLDAVKEYYSGAPQANIEFLSWLTDEVKSQKEDAYLVGEAWLPMTEYAPYYESGIDSVFDFAFADKDGIISKVLNGSPASRYGETVASLAEVFGSYHEDYIDAPFYTNHDLGRSAGYYAGDYSENQTKLAAAMNLFMSGSAFIYYGEELGMKGSGKDENKRAPMYWSMDADAEGMCDGPADMDAVKMKFESLEEQQSDEQSVYNFYKKVIKVRNQNPEIARGSAEYLGEVSTDTVCVLRKAYEGSEVLLVFVTGQEAEEVDLSGVTVNGNVFGDGTQVRAMLVTGEEQIALEGSVAKMPGYSVMVMK
ncbi:MAG: alpha-amylase family glycosyl hydrolase [Eubacterium sp.]|nr:alpha-amylase family glycosyl hydrolase [Eubacterium sp.]